MNALGHASEIRRGDRFYADSHAAYVTAETNAYPSPNGLCHEVVARLPEGGTESLRFGLAQKVRFN